MFPTVANTCVSILKISLQTLTPVPFVQTASKLFPISTHNVFILDKAFFADSITPLPFASQDCFIAKKFIQSLRPGSMIWMEKFIVFLVLLLDVLLQETAIPRSVP